eukprot:scaffold59827_cov51-Attheya_sp.AAC.2
MPLTLSNSKILFLRLFFTSSLNFFFAPDVWVQMSNQYCLSPMALRRLEYFYEEFVYPVSRMLNTSQA